MSYAAWYEAITPVMTFGVHGRLCGLLCFITDCELGTCDFQTLVEKKCDVTFLTAQSQT